MLRARQRKGGDGAETVQRSGGGYRFYKYPGLAKAGLLLRVFIIGKVRKTAGLPP